MGKKGKWFGAVKRVFSPESKKSKKKLEPGSPKISILQSTEIPISSSNGTASQHHEDLKLVDAEKEQSKNAYNVAAVASEDSTEAAIATSQAVSEVVFLATPATKFAGKSTEEIAAIKIQTTFRGHLARRALRALRGLVRLKTLLDGNSVKRQVTTTLRNMQMLARVQSHIRARRVRMSEENQALQRQLLLKHERELESLKMAEEWDDSLQSKEQIEASLTSKQEAALRRERALAYAFTHQLKSSSRSANPMFIDPRNPQWGWSWLERWMAAKPWEAKKATDKELTSDIASIKSAGQNVGGGEILKAFARRDTATDKVSPVAQKPSRPPSRQSPATPTPRAPWTMSKLKSASVKNGVGLGEDDSRSIASMQSERPRRHSIATSSVRDDESLASSPAVPSYMAPTESARAKSRFQSPLNDDVEIAEKPVVASIKKKLSFPASPAPARRHSGPPKVNLSSVKNVEVQS